MSAERGEAEGRHCFLSPSPPRGYLSSDGAGPGATFRDFFSFTFLAHMTLDSLTVSGSALLSSRARRLYSSRPEVCVLCRTSRGVARRAHAYALSRSRDADGRRTALRGALFTHHLRSCTFIPLRRSPQDSHHEHERAAGAAAGDGALRVPNRESDRTPNTVPLVSTEARVPQEQARAS